MRHRDPRPQQRAIRVMLPWLLGLSSIASTACGTADDAAKAPHPKRLAVMAPAIAEILVALELDEQIVAVGDYVDRPDSLSDLPRIGAYDGPSIERIVELEIDLYLTTRSQAAGRAHARLASLGIEVADLDTSTLESLFESIERIGDLLDRKEPARSLLRRMRQGIAEIEREAESLERRSVLIVVGRDPLYVAGPGSHLDQMVRLAGGSNVFSDSGEPYRRVSLEAALERLPQVIIDSSDNRDGAPRGRLVSGWSEWEFLPAVRENRVYWLDPSLLSIPGSRIPEMTRLVAQLIHPERFGEATTFEADSR